MESSSNNDQSFSQQQNHEKDMEVDLQQNQKIIHQLEDEHIQFEDFSDIFSSSLNNFNEGQINQNNNNQSCVRGQSTNNANQTIGTCTGSQSYCFSQFKQDSKIKNSFNNVKQFQQQHFELSFDKNSLFKKSLSKVNNNLEQDNILQKKSQSNPQSPLIFQKLMIDENFENSRENFLFEKNNTKQDNNQFQIISEQDKNQLQNLEEQRENSGLKVYRLYSDEKLNENELNNQKSSIEDDVLNQQQKFEEDKMSCYYNNNSSNKQIPSNFSSNVFDSQQYRNLEFQNGLDFFIINQKQLSNEKQNNQYQYSQHSNSIENELNKKFYQQQNDIIQNQQYLSSPSIENVLSHYNQNEQKQDMQCTSEQHSDSIESEFNIKCQNLDKQQQNYIENEVNNDIKISSSQNENDQIIKNNISEKITKIDTSNSNQIIKAQEPQQNSNSKNLFENMKKKQLYLNYFQGFLKQKKETKGKKFLTDSEKSNSSLLQSQMSDELSSLIQSPTVTGQINNRRVSERIRQKQLQKESQQQNVKLNQNNNLNKLSQLSQQTKLETIIEEEKDKEEEFQDNKQLTQCSSNLINQNHLQENSQQQQKQKILKRSKKISKQKEQLSNNKIISQIDDNFVSNNVEKNQKVEKQEKEIKSRKQLKIELINSYKQKFRMILSQKVQINADGKYQIIFNNQNNHIFNQQPSIINNNKEEDKKQMNIDQICTTKQSHGYNLRSKKIEEIVQVKKNQKLIKKIQNLVPVQNSIHRYNLRNRKNNQIQVQKQSSQQSQTVSIEIKIEQEQGLSQHSQSINQKINQDNQQENQIFNDDYQNEQQQLQQQNNEEVKPKEMIDNRIEIKKNIYLLRQIQSYFRINQETIFKDVIFHNKLKSQFNNFQNETQFSLVFEKKQITKSKNNILVKFVSEDKQLWQFQIEGALQNQTIQFKQKLLFLTHSKEENFYKIYQFAQKNKQHKMEINQDFVQINEKIVFFKKIRSELIIITQDLQVYLINLQKNQLELEKYSAFDNLLIEKRTLLIQQVNNQDKVQMIEELIKKLNEQCKNNNIFAFLKEPYISQK